MKTAKVALDSNCSAKALIEKSERRIFKAIQIFAIGIVLLFFFLAYLLYLIVKTNMDFTVDVAKRHLKEVRRIDSLEKQVGAIGASIQEGRDSKCASDETTAIKP